MPRLSDSHDRNVSRPPHRALFGRLAGRGPMRETVRGAPGLASEKVTMPLVFTGRACISWPRWATPPRKLTSTSDSLPSRGELSSLPPCDMAGRAPRQLRAGVTPGGRAPGSTPAKHAHVCLPSITLNSASKPQDQHRVHEPHPLCPRPLRRRSPRVHGVQPSFRGCGREIRRSWLGPAQPLPTADALMHRRTSCILRSHRS